MPLLNITNSFNAYDVVTIEGGVATLLDITTTPSGIVGVVITNNYIAIDEQLQIDMVVGVAPTSNSDLYDKLIALII